MLQNRITIVSGHFGSGKTNIAVGLALKKCAAGHRVRAIDLDTVNPYFRLADSVSRLESEHITCMIPQYANTNVDIPSLPDGYDDIFFTSDDCIIDVGGDAEGAVVLAADAERLCNIGYDMLYVVNFMRPMTQNAESALEMLRHIEHISHLKFTHIINNTNLGAETDEALVASHIPEAMRLSQMAGIPIEATTAFFAGEGITKITDSTRRLF